MSDTLRHLSGTVVAVATRMVLALPRPRRLAPLLLLLSVLQLAGSGDSVAWGKSRGSARWWGWRLPTPTLQRQRRHIARNARIGRWRQFWALTKTRLVHPLSSIQTERALVDSRGRAALDRSGHGRRFDIAVISPFGRLSALIEVTGSRTDKRAQDAKTRQILARYRKLYIVDKRSGELRALRRGWLWPTKISKDRI